VALPGGLEECGLAFGPGPAAGGGRSATANLTQMDNPLHQYRPADRSSQRARYREEGAVSVSWLPWRQTRSGHRPVTDYRGLSNRAVTWATTWRLLERRSGCLRTSALAAPLTRKRKGPGMSRCGARLVQFVCAPRPGR
jgi:hypothetical protein